MRKQRSKGARHRAGAVVHEAPAGLIPRSRAKLTRAKIRHFLFTVAPDRIMRGMLKRRHLERPVELRELTLHVPSWPEAWEGVRIAHLSDFHLGELMPVDRALALVDRVAKAKPDLLACTGDVVDLDWHGAEPLLAAMGDVPAALGRYLVLGNHDLLDDPIALSRAARRCGLRVLHGTVEHAGRSEDASRGEPGGGPIRVGGIDWGRTKRELSKHVHALPERPDLLLAHNPKAFPAAARLGVPLTLAGHTHGGQVGLPDRTVRHRRTRMDDASGRNSGGLPDARETRHPARAGEPAELAGDGAAARGAAAQERESRHGTAPAQARARALRRGLYAQGESRLFVSVGAGSWFPARVNCPAEMLILTVRR